MVFLFQTDRSLRASPHPLSLNALFTFHFPIKLWSPESEVIGSILSVGQLTAMAVFLNVLPARYWKSFKDGTKIWSLPFELLPKGKH